MEITDQTQHGQRDPVEQAAHNTGVAMRTGCDLIQALLDAFTGTRRPETPPELPANVVPYPQQVGPRVTNPRPQAASVALCPSSVRADLIDWDWLSRDIRAAGLDITVTRSVRP